MRTLSRIVAVTAAILFLVGLVRAGAEVASAESAQGVRATTPWLHHSLGVRADSSYGHNVEVAKGEVREKDLAVFGGNVSVDGQVTRDLVVFGGNVSVTGTIGRDLILTGGNLDLQGEIGRDAVVTGGNVTLGPKSSVGRDVAVAGGNLDRDPAAKVGRQVTIGGPPRWSWGGMPDFGMATFFGVIVALSILLLALLAMVFFPQQLQVTSTLLEQRPLESTGLGCLGVMAGIALSLLLAITVILLPVSFLIVVTMLVAWLFGWAAIFAVAGQRLLTAANRTATPVFALLAGGLLFALLANIPGLNVLVILVGGSTALGIGLWSRLGTRMPPPRAPAAPPPLPQPPV